MSKRQAIVIGLAVIAVGATGVLAQSGSDISRTRHNLTASGPGPVRVVGANQICKFCHTPHSASPRAPLWNREDSGAYYQTYQSTTMTAEVGQPTGSSRLCLSCHDGTIALTQTYNARNGIPGGTVYLTARDRGYIGTDLTDDHPISFVYDSTLAIQDRQLRDPASLPEEIPLDNGQELQCTTCHDAHDDRYGQFLRMDNTASKMCISCHDIEGWIDSPHAYSPAALSGSNREKWDNINAATVRDAACASCHRPHSAGGRERLLRHEAEEDNCLTCHDGSVASRDIATQLNKISVHDPRRTTGVHDPTESPLSMPEHVECSDCHNPHRSGGISIARAPSVPPSMRGASGVSSSGIPVEVARYEYEVCYKCHAQDNVSRSVVDRVLGTNDVSSEFRPTNASYHPVETIGQNLDVPSLRTAYTATTIIYCTDCHGSDSAKAVGPHGSQYRPLLVRQYATFDPGAESQQSYALCYECHSRTSILNDESFAEHKKHIDEERTACSTCHDPHGVAQNTHLINFDRDVVEKSPSAGTGPSFNDTGRFRGNCTLMCHGEDHNNEAYD